MRRIFRFIDGANVNRRMDNMSFFYKNFISICVILKLAAAAVLYCNEVFENEIGRIWNFCKESQNAD